MEELDDIALLRQYTEDDSEEAFAALVTRHINKIYSVALRHTRNPHQAEEITQAVFVILARKSRHLSKHVVLSGWLYQTARLTAVTLIRGEIRRARREQAVYMQTSLNEKDSDVWSRIAPLLDAAMAGLNEADRHAIVLRYFDGKSMKEIGATLGASEDAIKKRLNRAVEKLRLFFKKCGVVVPATVLTATISTNSVQAAPAMLAKSAMSVAMTGGTAASGSTLTLAKGALKIMAWTNMKTAVVIGAAIILTAGTATTVLVKHPHQKTARTDFPKSSWAFAGYADPVSALETSFWASSRKDGQAMTASITPDLLRQVQQQVGNELHKRGITLEQFFSERGNPLVGTSGFHVLRQETIAEDQVRVHLAMDGKKGEQVFELKKIGQEWKVNQYPSRF